MDFQPSTQSMDSITGMEALQEVHAGLLQLHAKTDAFFKTVHRRHETRMQCAPGCDGCCQRMPSVFAVEAWIIARTVRDAPASAVERLLRDLAALEGQSEVSPCCMLDGRGHCRTYLSRPVLCRSHGAPVLVPGGNGRFDVCPLNFTKSGMRQSIAHEDVLDSDRLNEILSVIDSLFRQAVPGGDKMPLRLPLAHGVLFFMKCDY